MKTAFLFPGQGAQTVGMGQDVYGAYEAYAEAFDACARGAGLDLRAACFDGVGLDNGEIVQPAIVAHSMGLFNTVCQAGVTADIYAGLSLGEYSALCAAGAFSFGRCAALVRQRGRIMDAAFIPGEAGMLSVIGLPVDVVEGIVRGREGLFVANHLSAAQIVVAGAQADLERIRPVFEERGARMTVMLNVRGPSHAPILQDAAEAFSCALADEPIGSIGNKTVYSGALGAPYEEFSDIKALLARQMRVRLRWHECVEDMLRRGVNRFVEIGPSNVLSKLIKRRAKKDAEVISIRDLRTLQAFLSAQEGLDE